MTYITELAHRMVVRHLQISMPDEALREDMLAATDAAAECRSTLRVIAVVGAGASASYIERADELADYLVRHHERDLPGYEAELRRLELVNGMEPAHFETKLAALSRTEYGERTVRKAVANHLGFRHPVLLRYELLAHLMKHRFLDGIITVNFDELLDQSIEDEVGRGEYMPVISERDCVDVTFDAGEASYAPVYVKLHGTAADPASLRFTREAYYSLPDTIAEAVRSLLGTEECVVLNLGFGMRSFDFTQLLDEPGTLTIYNLSHDSLIGDALKEINIARQKKSRATIRDISWKDWRLANDDGSDHGMATLAAEVERLTREKAGDVAGIRGITRHELFTELLGGRKLDRRLDKVHYLEDRTTLEIAFSMLRARGLAPISSLIADRGGACFEQLRQLSPKARWSDVCRRGGLQEDPVSTDTYIPLDLLGGSRPPDAPAKLHFIEPKLLANHVGSSFRPPLSGEQIQRLANTFAEIQEGSETELHGRDNRITAKVFENPNYIHTITALRAQTLSMFRRTDYNQLAVVAETGEWLLDPAYLPLLQERIDEDRLSIMVVIAFDTKKAELLEKLGTKRRYQDRIHIVRTDWWRHNRHAAVFCSNETPLRAIYFVRRLRSPFISPVYLDTPTDAHRVYGHVKRQCLDGLEREAVAPCDISVAMSDLMARVDSVGSGTNGRSLPEPDIMGES